MNKLTKQMLAAWTALSLVSIPTMTEAATPPIQVYIDGAKQTYDAQPYIKNSRTLVPLRGIFEKLGANVYWDGTTQVILANKGDNVINLRIGSNKAVLNGKEVALDQAAEISNSRTMVPLRFISEALGADVKWNGTTYVITITSGVRPVSGLSQQGPGVLNLSLRHNIWTLNTSQAVDDVSLTVLGQVGEGLVRLNDQDQAVPGVAKEWKVSPDGLTYTFTLRDNAKWSDGSQVTAHDFEYAWKRNLSPESNTPHAFLLSWVKGANAYSTGEGSAEQVLVKAKDNTTLEVTLESPIPFFVEQTALPLYFPQRKAMATAIGYGSSVNKALYNGPFKLTTWINDQFAVLTKNEKYWDAESVKLNKINYVMATPDTDLGKLYQGKAIDFSPLSVDNITTYRGSADFGFQADARSTYLEFNNSDSVLKNAKIRKALSYAIDSDMIADKVYKNILKSATGLVPSGITDGLGGDFRTTGGDLIKRAENKQNAKSLLAEGMKELNLSALPKLTLMMDDSTATREHGTLLQQAWKQQLGIDVSVEYVDFRTRLERTYAGNFDIVLAVWGADFNDPMNFLDMWVTNSEFNSARYSNSNYDALIDQAQQEKDAAARMKLLHDAEQLLMNDMPIHPLYFRQAPFLKRPYVKGMTLAKGNGVGPLYDLKNSYLEGRP